MDTLPKPTAPEATAGIERRIDIEIPTPDKERMVGWLYSSQKYTPSNPGPAIVLAHGLGATKELKLDVYASKFNLLGYTCLVFDYRYSGDSTGLPRGLIDFAKQQEDWHTALAWVRALENVDAERVGIFGTSFGGGHVIQVGATDKRLKAVISQCPFTDGFKSALCCGVLTLPKLFALGLRDLATGTDEHPVTVALAGRPGQAALMNAKDVLEDLPALVPTNHALNLNVPARLIPTFPLLRPGAYAAKVECPILVAICAKDTVAPAKTTLAYAKKAPKGTVKWYDDMGHFDIYVGEKHERAFADYVEFLKENFPA